MKWHISSYQYKSYRLAIQSRQKIVNYLQYLLENLLKNTSSWLGVFKVMIYFKTPVHILSSPTHFISYKLEDSALLLKRQN